MGPPEAKKPRRSILVNFSVSSDGQEKALDVTSGQADSNVSLEANGDSVFDPCAEMLIHDYDDERTLEEEEALENNEDPLTELTDLQKEGDMPLSELLAMYGYDDKDSGSVKENEAAADSSDDVEETSKLVELYPEQIPVLTRTRFLRSGSRPQSEEEDEDGDYSPEEEDWKKTIMVGSDYQAKIPVGLYKYDDALPYENDDKILWNPSPLTESEITDFLSKAQKNTLTTHIKDDEQALFLLLQCGYNVEEALRRKRISCVTGTESMSIWSEDECRNFETGMRLYGKDFYTIQKTKVLTRSVGELVQFYYLWKKTERHDVYAHKSRLEKKKFTLYPGITDYMDRFLEEQAVGTNVSILMYSHDKKYNHGENGEAKSATAVQMIPTEKDLSPNVVNDFVADASAI